MTYCNVCRVHVEKEQVVAILDRRSVYCIECYNKFENHPWLESVIKQKTYKIIKV